MKERLQFLLLYYIFWIVYFISAKLVFLAYHINETKQLTLELIYGVFKMGLHMDLSMAAYLSLLPFLIVTFSHFIKKSKLETFLFSYTLLFVILITLMVVIDLEAYNVWKFRLDETPLNYLVSPREALASAKSSPIFQLVLSYIILISIAGYFVYRVISGQLDGWKFTKKLPFIPVSALLTLLLILPLRGGWSKKALAPGDLFFSSNYFANVSTLNTPWNFTYSLLKRFDSKLNPYTYLPRSEVSRSLRELYPEVETKSPKVLNFNQKPNVVFLVVESLSSKLLGKQQEGILVLPFLSSLKDSSVYFNSVYAAGDHTEKGLVALLNGYPSCPTKSIIYENSKVEKLPFLSKQLGKENFNTEFYYGGNTAFINLKDYLLLSDFKKIIDGSSFPDAQKLSEWGVHDDVLLTKFLDDHKAKSSQIFFSTLLTLSSHEPFDVPSNYIFSVKNSENDYYNSMKFVDNSIENFITKAKKEWWWDNTLVVIIGDHGHRFPISNSRFLDNKVPLIFTGGVVKKNQVYDQLISQFDIPKLILDELNFDSSVFTWSKNPLKKQQPQWSFFTFNNGFGFIAEDGKLLFDNIGKIPLYNDNSKTPRISLRQGKSLQQITYEDYLKK